MTDLLFDYRDFAKCDGEPLQFQFVRRQLKDYATAVRHPQGDGNWIQRSVFT